MARQFWFDRFGCLNLAEACLIFGLLNLALSISSFFLIFVGADRNWDWIQVVIVVAAVVSVATCLLMIIGSIWKMQWLMFPHILWQILSIISFTAITGIQLHALIEYQLSFIIQTIIFWAVALVFWVIYCNIVFSRFIEIRKKQSAKADVVEAN